MVLSLLVIQGLLFWFCCRRQIAALLSHKRQLKSRGDPSTGHLDLVSSHHGASTSHLGGDAATIDTDLPMSRRASSLFGTRRSRTVASDGGGGDATAAEMEDSISPFWDGALAGGEFGTMSSVGTGFSSGPFGSRAELLPPLSLNSRNSGSHSRHGRQDSLDSGLSRPLSMELPYLSSATSPSVPMSPVSPICGGTAGASPASTLPRSGMSRPSKAQLAAANPDEGLRVSSVASRRASGGAGAGAGRDLLPPETHVPQEAPAGGFRRHEDAGAVEDVEDLPPMYRPEWDGRSHRRESGGGV